MSGCVQTFDWYYTCVRDRDRDRYRKRERERRETGSVPKPNLTDVGMLAPPDCGVLNPSVAPLFQDGGGAGGGWRLWRLYRLRAALCAKESLFPRNGETNTQSNI